MSKYIVMTFATTPELKTCLEQWAAADDRSVSYILRDILKKECDRRDLRRQQAGQQAKDTRR